METRRKAESVTHALEGFGGGRKGELDRPVENTRADAADDELLATADQIIEAMRAHSRHFPSSFDTVRRGVAAKKALARKRAAGGM